MVVISALKESKKPTYNRKLCSAMHMAAQFLSGDSVSKKKNRLFLNTGIDVE